ncbi:MAG: hypothetical protein RL160_693 [Bacteroidota bacterium]|jgi:uncharacterized membrane protein YphA (DoxX/SURF4 family)
MKPLTLFSRLFVGCLFIFSGFIKLNDPTGFSIKLNEYFDVFGKDLSAKQDTLHVSVKEAGEVLELKSQQLYAFDDVKEVQFNTSASQVTDSSSGAFGQTSVSVYGVFDGDNFFSNEYYFPDSQSVRSILFTVKADSVVLFSKDFIIGIAHPHQFSHKVDVSKMVKKDSFLVGWFTAMKEYTVGMSILICVLEIILGITLLVGWQPVLTIWSLLLMILFFSFLTWYSAKYNKVTDCGCFGDFIKLKPWQSFYKDLVLLVFIMILFFRRKNIKPVFSPPFAWKLTALAGIASLALALFCYYRLPMFDFLPYKVGNDIREQMKVPAGERATDSIQMVFVMGKGSDSAEFTLKQWDSAKKAGWTYQRRKDKIIVPAFKPPIHDLEVTDPETGMSMLDSMLDSKGYKLIIVSAILEKARAQAAQKDLNTLAEAWTKAGHAVWALTGSEQGTQKAYRQEHGVPYRFYNTDGTVLKTMIRSNPGVLLLQGSKVLAKWPASNIPDLETVKKYMR